MFFVFFRYQANLEGHFKNVALRHMPPNVEKLKQQEKSKLLMLYFLLQVVPFLTCYALFTDSVSILVPCALSMVST